VRRLLCAMKRTGLFQSHRPTLFLGVESGGKKSTAWRRFKKKAFRMKMLLWWTLGGVALGIIIGAALYGVHPSSTAITLIGERAASPLSPKCQ
jgi:hypothetical protein